MMVVMVGAHCCRVWPSVGCTSFIIGATIVDVSIFLAFIAMNWFVCIFGDDHSGVSYKDPLQE